MRDELAMVKNIKDSDMRLPNEYTSFYGIRHAIGNSWLGRATSWWLFDRVLDFVLVLVCALYFLVVGLFCWGGFLCERLQKKWWDWTIRRGD